MFPWRTFDYDNDGDYTAALFAIQTGGSGVMTNAAWVTNVVSALVPSTGTQVTYASIRFDEISVDGVNVCTAGTYTLAAD